MKKVVIRGKIIAVSGAKTAYAMWINADFMILNPTAKLNSKMKSELVEYKNEIFAGIADKNAGFMRSSTSKVRDKMKKIVSAKNFIFRDFISFFNFVLIFSAV